MIKSLKRKKKSHLPAVHIDSVIQSIRGEKVILAVELAKIYGVETRALNQAVRRNIDKFPQDFMFQLTRKEANELHRSTSQFVTLKRGANIKYLPYAFTEHGAVMAANILRSRRAIEMSIFVVRAFIKMRQSMTTNKNLMEMLSKLEISLTKRLDAHEQAIVYVLTELRKLIDPPPLPGPERKPIGF